jgi:hypothetical protein
MMEAFGKTIVGDRLTGALYEMSSAFHTDVDDDEDDEVPTYIRRVRQAPRFSVDQKRVTVHSLQLVMDTGQGLVLGQGVDPQMMLTISRDGGQTFGNQRWESAGPIGAWSTRVKWDQCGQARNLVPRFVASDPIPWRVVDLLINFTVGLT